MTVSFSETSAGRSLIEGQTLVELIMVLVLVGILSTGASALLVGRGDFSSSLVKDQLIISIRLAQQSALSKTQGSNVTHSIARLSDDFVFDVSHSEHTSSLRLNGEGTTITWSNSSLTGSCGGVLGTLPHALNFDARGDTTETRYCIRGAKEYRVCVSALGFAFEGDCDT